MIREYLPCGLRGVVDALIATAIFSVACSGWSLSTSEIAAFKESAARSNSRSPVSFAAKSTSLLTCSMRRRSIFLPPPFWVSEKPVSA